MTFKENIHCHIPEEKWRKKEHEKCDADHPDPELNKFCHEVVDRDAQRRRELCEENPSKSKVASD